MVTLYIQNCSQLIESEQSIYLSMSENRQQKYDRQRQRSDRLATVAGAFLLQKAFGRAEGMLNINYTANGKPYISGERHFNISHSGEYCVLAVADVPVGADVQIHKASDFLNIAKNCFNIKEYTYLLGSKNVCKDFYIIWSLKESYIKATGKGLSMGLSNFYFEASNSSINCYNNQHQAIKDYSFKQLDIINNYSIAVCAKTTNLTVKVVE